MLDPNVFSFPATPYARALGNKQYEITDHLSNVRAVVYDYKEEQLNEEVQSVIAFTQDYWPNAVPPTSWWGMPLKRGLSGAGLGNEEGYEYAFNGQMKSDEVYGEGMLNTAQFWEYDTRLGRRWNLDPVVKPWESGYAILANNPIWFIDPSGADTTISGSVTAQSEIMKAEGDPDFVPPGVKLESTAQIDAKIVDGKFTQVTADVKAKEFESPVLWGLDPAFTEVRNKKIIISEDGLTATISYDVQTQLSNFEVVGQWFNTFFDDGTIQTNIITVTQSVEIVLKIGSITTTFDGSTFPESRYNASYNVDTETKMLKRTVNATLKQSSYYDTVKSATFRERNHPQKTSKTLTY